MADAFPGLIDGVLISATFPDALSTALAGLDGRLLSHYFHSGNIGGFSEAQIVAASAVLNAAVPSDARYDPVRNPTGARPTIFDAARHVYGVDRDGFALRPFDSVGVQYGLRQVNDRTITVDQFLDLNARIGGYDRDANFIETRTAADAGAVQRAYKSGLTLGANGGLGDIPIFDVSGLYDEDAVYHYQWFHFAVRERLKDTFPDAANHVMWRGGQPITAVFAGSSTPEERAVTTAAAQGSWETFIEWMDAYTADESARSLREKVIANKPAAAVDGCFTRSLEPEFIAEPQTLSSEPDSICNRMWPSWTVPRIQAGGPLSGNVLKCQLMPAERADYDVAFTDEQWSRLLDHFPGGVCDWSVRGAGQTDVVTYPSVGPSPANRIVQRSAAVVGGTR